jgi:hypothetical protein
MAKVIGGLAVVLGLTCLTLILSTHPAIIFGSAFIGFGLGFLICS